MKEEKPRSKKGAKRSNNKKKQEFDQEDSFDFGGFPKNVSLKKNMGCGG